MNITKISALLIVFISLILIYIGLSHVDNNPYFFGVFLGITLKFYLIASPIYAIGKWGLSKYNAQLWKNARLICYVLPFLFSAGMFCYQLQNLEIMQQEKVTEALADAPEWHSEENFLESQYGEAAPFLNLIKKSIKINKEEMARNELALDNADMESWLNNYSFGSSDAIQEKHRALKGLNRALKESKNTKSTQKQELEAEFKKLTHLGEEVESYNAFQNEYDAIIGEWYQVFHKQMVEYRRFLDFLLSVQGLYEPESETNMLFDRDSDAEKYMMHIEKLNKFGEKSVEILQKLEDFGRKR